MFGRKRALSHTEFVTPRGHKLSKMGLISWLSVFTSGRCIVYDQHEKTRLTDVNLLFPVERATKKKKDGRHRSSPPEKDAPAAPSLVSFSQFAVCVHTNVPRSSREENCTCFLNKQHILLLWVFIFSTPSSPFGYGLTDEGVHASLQSLFKYTYWLKLKLSGLLCSCSSFTVSAVFFVIFGLGLHWDANKLVYSRKIRSPNVGGMRF